MSLRAITTRCCRTRLLQAQTSLPSSLPRRFALSTSAPSPNSPAPPPPLPRRDPRASAYSEARQAHYKRRNRSLLLYSSATIILVTTASYLAVPLYRVFCSQTGYGGTPQTDSSRFSPDRLVPVTEQEAGRRIRVQFNADSSDSLPWTFTPQQKEVRVLPGETALAFYTAKNNSPDDIIGIATYNVTPNNVSRPPLFARCLVAADTSPNPRYVRTRSHPTLPKSSASASKSNGSWPVKKLICPSFSSSTAISWTTRS